MNQSVVKTLLERIIRFLRKDNLNLESVTIRERTSKFEIYIKLGDNPYGMKVIKLLFSKNKNTYRVYTGKTSIDLRLKRFIKRELSKLGVNE